MKTENTFQRKPKQLNILFLRDCCAALGVAPLK